MAIFNNLRRRARQEKQKAEPVPEVETFTPTQAEKMVQKVAMNVSLMLGDSPLFGDSRSKNESYSLFKRNEVQTGRRLGSGGFSDVYEIEGFEPTPTKGYHSEGQEFSRQFYADTAKRENGESRYVMKHLRPELMRDTKKFQMAASDLVMEGQFLSSLDHPHILKLRAWSAESVGAYREGSHDGYFLVLDRLSGDLSGKIEQWKMERNRMRRNKVSKAEKNKALVERVKVAYQIACALDYLHEQGIIFRDLKPANIGLDGDGNVKLFDFGLAREVPDGSMDEVFTMSGQIGTRRYMAPEVALNEQYNLKADVYSWACNFYEILGLEKPYATMNKDMHKQFCCKQGLRPDMRRGWPESIKALLKMSWHADISSRPTMKQVVESLKSILMELDSTNTDVLAIRERRRRSVVLELPANFASSMAFTDKGEKRMGGDTTTLGTSPESLGESLNAASNCA